MKAYVICCNNAVVAVVTDGEKLAHLRKSQIAKKAYQQIRRDHLNISMEEYLEVLSWHLHAVNVIG